MRCYVYIIANRPRGAMSVDVTHDLARRDSASRERARAGFSPRRRRRGTAGTERGDPTQKTDQSQKTGQTRNTEKAGTGKTDTGETETGDRRRLVYYEERPSLLDALAREKTIRGWSRDKKIQHIERLNPGWRDLSADMNGTHFGPTDVIPAAAGFSVRLTGG